MLGALTFGAKFVMSGLPNIEPVSLMVMVYAVVLGAKALYPIYIYVMLEILVYGLGDWNVMYLYIWPLLWLMAWASNILCLLKWQETFFTYNYIYILE